MKQFTLVFFAFVFGVHCFSQEKKNGKIEILNADRSISVGKNKNWKKEGKWVTTLSTGKVSVEANYHEGIYHGYYSEYNAYGKLYKCGNYVNGHKEGTWYLFDPKGDTTRIDNFVNDTLHGYCRIRDFSGAIFSGNIAHGKYEGLWVLKGREGSGSVDSIHYLNNQYHGPTKKYQNGTLIYECNYQYNERHGTGIEYYAGTHQIKTITQYNQGKITGVCKNYFSDGTLKSVHSYDKAPLPDYDSAWKIKNGKRFLARVTITAQNGSTVSEVRYYDNGQVQFREYSGDDWQADSTFVYYRGGELFRQAYYDSTYPGSKVMAVREYSVNGKMTFSGHHQIGLRVGLCTYYDSVSGIKLKQITYVGGRTEGRYTNYYPNGKTRLSGVCHDNYLSDSIRVYSSSGVLLTKGTKLYNEIWTRVLLEDPELHFRDPDRELGFQNQEGEADEVMDAIDVVEEPAPDEIFTYAEEMPSFPGDSANTWIARHIQYPPIERETGKTGTVYVQFVVETDGSVTNVKVAKGVPGAPGFSSEAVRVVSAMPKWKPGRMNGRAVRVQMTQPVRFVLQ